ncbi:MAG TPA: recombinase family protein [Verrucomicrobiota bacterium]|nr:recombinase family protein [Verrucomicrobiota bacterium]
MRVSTTRQGVDGYGATAQREAIERYAKQDPDSTLLQVFCEAESGRLNDRPQLREAIKLAKAKGAKLVIAKLDRLSRNAAFLMSLQDSNLDFVALDCPSADRFTIGVLALVAERERQLISQRTKAALAVARERGAKIGNPRLADARKTAVQAVQAQKRAFCETAIKSIREVQSTGITSLNRIADCLTKRGERTSRGGAWTATSVKRVLVAHSLIWPESVQIHA